MDRSANVTDGISSIVAAEPSESPQNLVAPIEAGETVVAPPAAEDAAERKRLKRQRKEEKRKKKEEKEERKKRKREVRVVQPAAAPSHETGVNEASSSIPDAKRRRPNDAAPVPTARSSMALPALGGLSLPLAADSARQENTPLVDFTSSMKLKVDNAVRPAIVCPTGYIYLDMNSIFSRPASDFLVTVAEPVSRPENIHEFQITVFSLYAAIGVGMSVDDILRNLNKFSKNDIPEVLERLLRMHGSAFGRVKLVLRDNRYYLEASTREDLEYMLSNPSIAEARIRNSTSTRQVSNFIIRWIFKSDLGLIVRFVQDPHH